jgi:predicted ABC-type ATPase
MKKLKPQVIILAGPNGGGKSTAAPKLLRDAFEVEEYVNADAIAFGLSAFAPEKAAIEAGRIMLNRLHKLAEKRRNFAFETTLAARSFAPWLSAMMALGYESHVFFLALPSAEMAISRVAGRVRLGGHNIPENIIRKRFNSGLANFFDLYQPMVTSWLFYDNSFLGFPLLVARGSGPVSVKVHDSVMYEAFLKEYSHER